MKFDECWTAEHYLAGNTIRADTSIEVDVEIGVASLSL